MNKTAQKKQIFQRHSEKYFHKRICFLLLCCILYSATVPISGQENGLPSPLQDSLFTTRENPYIQASDPNVYTRCTSYGLGWANVFDTYLSPQAYHGIEFRFMRESIPATYPHPRQNSWLRQSFFQGFASYTKHPSDDNHEMSAMGEWRWGYLYNFNTQAFCPQLELQAGGQLYGQGGLIYNLANGNNPVALKLGIGVGATGRAAYHFHLGKRNFAVRYQFFAPVIGALFSPHYGQSYYEIFSLGHSDGVVRFASLHNQPSLWQHLSLDFPLFRKSTLRFSYVADIRQTKVYDLKYHQWSHCFLLGIVHRFQKL